jgi:4-hydroxy-3-methylbut-2-en-1-yl diphosphate synthase IspG/GcpE
MDALTDISKVVEHTRALEEMGCCVVVFTAEELRGANPSHVEDRLIELGWDVIDALADEPKDSPSEDEWNWAIK